MFCFLAELNAGGAVGGTDHNLQLQVQGSSVPWDTEGIEGGLTVPTRQVALLAAVCPVSGSPPRLCVPYQLQVQCGVLVWRAVGERCCQALGGCRAGGDVEQEMCVCGAMLQEHSQQHCCSHLCPSISVQSLRLAWKVKLEREPFFFLSISLCNGHTLVF